MLNDTVGWRALSVLKCAAMIFILRTALRMWGFARVLSWIGSRVQAIPQSTSLEIEAVQTAEHAVAMAGALYPGRALCLEQSLVLYYLLRRQGVAVEYCQGVVPRPFEAHAWIEYRGEVINDIAEHAKLYTRLPRQVS